MKKQNPSDRIGIIEAVKTPLGFFTLASLVVEATLGGLAYRLSGNPQLIALWGMIGTLLLLIVIVALIAIYRPESLGPTGGPVPIPDLDAISGAWWELIPNDPHIAISYFEITTTANLQVHLEGTAYDPSGIRMGAWRSEWACFNHNTRELFYYWVGDHFSPDTHDKDFSGVGLLYFGQARKLRAFEHGTGWFTFGNLRELKLEGRRKIDIRRVTDTERKQITDDETKAAVALSVFKQWAKTLPARANPET